MDLAVATSIAIVAVAIVYSAAIVRTAVRREPVYPLEPGDRAPSRPATLDDIMTRRVVDRLTLRQIERAGVVMFVVDPQGTIIYTAGGALPLYAAASGRTLTPDTVTGTSMLRDWPQPQIYLDAVRRLHEPGGPSQVTIRSDGWLLPSTVSYTLDPATGTVIGVCIPDPPDAQPTDPA